MVGAWLLLVAAIGVEVAATSALPRTQGFRDPGFLGIDNPENDAVYLPLRKGSNDLVLALSELGGGWGFNCRLEDVPD